MWWFVKKANRLNLAFSKFRKSIPFPSRGFIRMLPKIMGITSWVTCIMIFLGSSAHLTSSVFHVILLRTKKKVVRIDANLIVTFMANEQLSWVNTISQKIGNTMSIKTAQIPGTRPRAVSVLAACTSPWPAFVWGEAFHSGPKSRSLLQAKIRHRFIFHKPILALRSARVNTVPYRICYATATVEAM